MMKNRVFSVGVMSGTSLDGVDLVYVSFDKKNYKDFEIYAAETISYTKDWQSILSNAIHQPKEVLIELDVEYGRFLGETILAFMQQHQIKTLDFIASHGHTVLHEPKKGITLQIGSGQEVANITNTKVVCDFRTQDVEFGGQGAPLVPVGDEILFSEYEYCINLGGFSNVSFVKNNERIAFDICPVNIVLNHYVHQLGFAFDEGGKIAAKGKVNKLLLEELNKLEYYQKAPPKSLGLEWVQKHVFPLIDTKDISIEDILRTFVEHIALQIAKVIKGSTNVLFTGGGTFNNFLIERVQFYASININLASKTIINYKEALVFSLLGLLKINNEINCLKSVTGAQKNHSSGVVFTT
ncbi:MAG: anhydro-N-acetylmuramic acid kinase [Flavobacteriaceae bacterium]|nr:anhydro-N-acetylmuramic acid kinase [Flavobacteriaceae bacterium]